MISKNGKNYGYFRVAAAVPRIYVGDPERNAREMAAITQEAASRGVQAIAFPELSITGYSVKDYLEQRWLKEKAKEGLALYLSLTRGLKILSFLGMPLTVDEQRFNVSVACCNGEIKKIRPKIYLANNNEFQEARWFASADCLMSKEINLCGQRVPIGTDILLEIEHVSDLLISDEICHDLFMPIPPSSFDCMYARIIFNLSASPEKVAKARYRKSLVENQSARCFAGYVYTSATSCSPNGSGESTSGSVMGGHALIYESGIKLAEKERFERESGFIVADIDYDFLGRERENECGFSQAIGRFRVPYRRVSCGVQELDVTKGLNRQIKARPFVPEDQHELAENCYDVFAIQTAAIGHRLEHVASITKKDELEVTIGISGGLDSALTLISAVRTYDMLRWDRKNIKAVTMPGFGTSDETLQDAIDLCSALRVSFSKISIVESVTRHLQNINAPCTFNEKREPCKKCLQCENAQARERTKILMDLGFNLGSGDLSELAVGWCTKNADQTAMYNGNGGIPKTMIQFVVKYVADTAEFGAEVSRILSRIVARPPSPELIESRGVDNIVQKTDEKIGPLELRDFFMYHMQRNGFTPKKIFFLAEVANSYPVGKGFDKKYNDPELLKWLLAYYERFFAAQYKREDAPDSPQVGTVNFNSRANYRAPSDMHGGTWSVNIKKLLV